MQHNNVNKKRKHDDIDTMNDRPNKKYKNTLLRATKSEFKYNDGQTVSSGTLILHNGQQGPASKYVIYETNEPITKAHAYNAKRIYKPRLPKLDRNNFRMPNGALLPPNAEVAAQDPNDITTSRRYYIKGTHQAVISVATLKKKKMDYEIDNSHTAEASTIALSDVETIPKIVDLTLATLDLTTKNNAKVEELLNLLNQCIVFSTIYANNFFLSLSLNDADPNSDTGPSSNHSTNIVVSSNHFTLFSANNTISSEPTSQANKPEPEDTSPRNNIYDDFNIHDFLF